MQIAERSLPPGSDRTMADAAGFARQALRPLSLALIALAAVIVGWTGYIASDDYLYYLGAVQWIENPPFAGVDHWTTRYPVVLTLAATILLFGDGPAALGANALFWYAAFVAAGAHLARRIGGRDVAWIAAVLLATMPLTAVAASIVNCDLAEATFLLVGAALLLPSGGGEARPAAALGAGICFALAVLSRETALLALSAMALFLLAGRPVARKTILIAAAGGALAMAADLAFQWAMTGDPFHRYALAINHDPDLSRLAAQEGNLLVHPLLDPLLVLLVNNEFGFLFWIAAAALASGALRSLRPEQRARLVLIGGMALASFLIVAALSTKLVLNPRYFTLLATVAAIVSAIWLARLHAAPRFALLAAAVGANFLALGLQNPHPRWSAEALVLAAAAHPGTAISADPDTLSRAELPLEWASLGNAWAGDAPLALVEADAAAGRPVAGRYPAPPRPIAQLLVRLGLEPILPAPVRSALATGPDMVLVRTGHADAPVTPASRR